MSKANLAAAREREREREREKGGEGEKGKPYCVYRVETAVRTDTANISSLPKVAAKPRLRTVAPRNRRNVRPRFI